VPHTTTTDRVSRWNPAMSAEQYGLALAVLSGRVRERTGMSKEVAQEIVDRTPHKDRVKFAKELARHRRNKSKGPVGSTLETFSKAGSYLDQQLGKVVGHNPQQKVERFGTEAAAKAYKRLLEHEGWRVRVTMEPEVRGEEWKAEATRKNPDDDSERGRLEAEVRYYSNELKKFPKGSMGLTPDSVRATFDWKEAKRGYDKAFAQLRQYNKTHKRKRNPEDEAADMYSAFHGKPSESVDEFVEDEHYHGNLAQLGELVELKICTVSGFDCTLSFETLGVQLASNEDGTQMYFVGGDQSLPLDKIHMDGDDYKKDSMVIGEVYFLSYFTEKDFDDFEPIIYEHELGIDEDTKKKLPCPALRYDCLNEKIYLDGGAYVIKKPMFETSRGIER
jgi:hypothetical protein